MIFVEKPVRREANGRFVEYLQTKAGAKRLFYETSQLRRNDPLFMLRNVPLFGDELAWRRNV